MRWIDLFLGYLTMFYQFHGLYTVESDGRFVMNGQ
jgi:hypothetical protein